MKRYLIIVGIIACVGALIATTRLRHSTLPSASVAAPMPYIIINDTEALNVIKSSLEGGMLILLLRNDGDKPIVAFRIETSPKQGTAQDLTISTPLQPGSEMNAFLPYASLEKIDQTTRRVRIMTALYDDGSAEGDWDESVRQREVIEGAALALKTIKAKTGRVQQFNKPALEGVAQDFDNCKAPPELNRNQAAGYLNAMQNAIVGIKIMNDPRFKGGRQNYFDQFKARIEKQISNTGQITAQRRQPQ